MKLPKFFKIGCGAAEILTVKVGAFLLSKIVGRMAHDKNKSNIYSLYNNKTLSKGMVWK